MNRKPTIVVLCDAYLPGYKSGGPIRTLANMVEQLRDDFAFQIITRDRERLGSVSYPGCKTGTWQEVGKAKVMYCSPEEWTIRAARRVLRETPHDLMYLNSFFSPRFALLPLILQYTGIIPRKPTVLAPRGELSPGALGIKKSKKHVFLRCARFIGLYRQVQWQASAPQEQADIRRWFGDSVSVVIAPNLRCGGSFSVNHYAARTKQAGELEIVFLSRISRKKNLLGALRVLAGVRGRVALHIYGPKEETAYWQECEEVIASLPDHIHVDYHGPVPNSEVVTTLRQHHLFLLPTLGENFGHVFVEALVAGLPLVISDQTPWRNLVDKGVGYDLPVDSPEAFQAAIQRFIAMGDNDYRQWSCRARQYGERVANDPGVVEANRRFLLRAIEEKVLS